MVGNSEARMYEMHGIVFARFGEGRYHVLRATYGNPDSVFLGYIRKEYGVYYFTPCAPGSLCYVGASRSDVIERYLSDQEKESSHD